MLDSMMYPPRPAPQQRPPILRSDMIQNLIAPPGGRPPIVDPSRLPGPTPPLTPFIGPGAPHRDTIIGSKPNPMGGGYPPPPGPGGRIQGPMMPSLPQLRKQLAMINLIQMFARLGKHAQAHVGDLNQPSMRFPGSNLGGG